MSQSLISQNENDPETIAQLIFNTGFSTAHKVTEISGRGVGMSAIRAYTEEAGGTLAIILKEKNQSLDQQAPIEFCLTLDDGLFITSDSIAS